MRRVVAQEHCMKFALCYCKALGGTNNSPNLDMLKAGLAVSIDEKCFQKSSLQYSDHSTPSSTFTQATLCNKTTIHQVTTMLATSQNVLFPGHNHLLTTGTDDLTL